MANNNLVKGLILGAVVVSAAPLLISALGGRRDALGRGLLRAGGVLAEKARETFAELAEVAEDVAADLQAVEPEVPVEDKVRPAETVERPGAAAGGSA